MIFQASKPIVLAAWTLIVLTACAQPPNYAPVITVNQAIEPYDGYVREKSPVNPDYIQDRPQQSTEIVHKEQEDNPVRQNPIINRSVHPAVDKNPVSKPQASPTTGQQPTDPSKNKPIISSANNITSQKKPQKTVKPTENIQITQKNNKEKKSIISIDNKKVLKLKFRWPIRGKISRNFTQTDSKGIDITGKTEQLVRAAEAGKVVYCGQGFAGFGNLAIIKHNETYLSAYANNSKLYIKEGQQVEKGQTIGQVGLTGLKKASLHFEIRKNGKPINPLTLLPKH